MKKDIIITIVLLNLAVVLNAQSLPPTGPMGNPVPLGGGSLIALILGGIFIFFRKKNG